MEAKTYQQKLKDPRWQRKRLEIFERDNFECQSCGNMDTQLHVHHREYKDVNPWEYDNGVLITLCEDCHKSVSKSISVIKEYVNNIVSADEALIVEKISEVFSSFDLTELNAIQSICYSLIKLNKENRDILCNALLNTLKVEP